MFVAKRYLEMHPKGKDNIPTGKKLNRLAWRENNKTVM